MTKGKSSSASLRHTLRRICIALAGFLLITLIFGLTIHPFLAQTEPLYGELLAVEGWLPDYALEEALKEFRIGGYKLMVTTGEPLVRGFSLAEYKTHAEMARAILLRMGASPDSLTAVPAPAARMDRTYAAAVAVRSWLNTTNTSVSAIDVFSHGAHARRSRMLFQHALGDSIQVGVFSGSDKSYDASSWWATSRGFQDVVMETIGFLYASIWPPRDE